MNDKEELVNVILNTNALLLLLYGKGVIGKREFEESKEEALKNFKREYPYLFKE